MDETDFCTCSEQSIVECSAMKTKSIPETKCICKEETQCATNILKANVESVETIMEITERNKIEAENKRRSIIEECKKQCSALRARRQQQNFCQANVSITTIFERTERTEKKHSCSANKAKKAEIEKEQSKNPCICAKATCISTIKSKAENQNQFKNITDICDCLPKKECSANKTPKCECKKECNAVKHSNLKAKDSCTCKSLKTKRSSRTKSEKSNKSDVSIEVIPEDFMVTVKNKDKTNEYCACTGQTTFETDNLNFIIEAQKDKHDSIRGFSINIHQKSTDDCNADSNKPKPSTSGTKSSISKEDNSCTCTIAPSACSAGSSNIKIVNEESKTRSSYPFKKDAVQNAIGALEQEMKPLKEALTSLRSKIRELNLPETNAILMETNSFCNPCGNLYIPKKRYMSSFYGVGNPIVPTPQPTVDYHQRSYGREYGRNYAPSSPVKRKMYMSSESDSSRTYHGKQKKSDKRHKPCTKCSTTSSSSVETKSSCPFIEAMKTFSSKLSSSGSSTQNYQYNISVNTVSPIQSDNEDSPTSCACTGK